MDYLYHYYERETGPFVSLSNSTIEEAQQIQNRLKAENETFAAKRDDRYLTRRQYLEQLVRSMFIEKGGQPIRQTPHYMVIGECPRLAAWYKNGVYIKIPIKEFDMKTVSFTYGDTFPTFSPNVTDDLEYRRKVYTYDEILVIIEKYGLPQDSWDEPIFAKPCYVEAQVWSDTPIKYYCAL